MEVVKDGFKKKALDDITIIADQTNALNIALDVGASVAVTSHRSSVACPMSSSTLSALACSAMILRSSRAFFLKPSLTTSILYGRGARPLKRNGRPHRSLLPACDSFLYP